jgi:HEAT repeat protein
MTRQIAALVALAAVAPAAVAQPKAPSSEFDPDVAAAVQVLKGGMPPEQLKAVRTLMELGPRAASAIPALLAATHQPGVDHAFFVAVVDAVAALGEPANPDVVRLCLATEYYGGRTGRGGRASAAPPSTDHIARHAAETLPVVADLLMDPDASTRRRASITLALLTSSNQDGKPSVFSGVPTAVRDHIVRRLGEALELPDVSTRAWAASALTDADPTSLPRTVPAILTATWGHADVGQVTRSLIHAGEPAARLVIDYLDEPKPDNRRIIANVLSVFGDVALPAFADGLRHPSPRVRASVIQAVRDSNRVPKLRAGLVARLSDPDEVVRALAADALTTVEPEKAGPAVPVLADLVFSRNIEVRTEALAGLARLGPVARPAVPSLLRRVQTGDAVTRFLTAEALAATDRSTWRTYVPVFVTTVKAEGSPYRARAIRDLGAAGSKATAALPALRDCFTGANFNLRVAAAEAVVRIEPKEIPDAVQCLADVLKDPGEGGNRRWTAWRSAMRALDAIGPQAREGVPALLDLVHRESDSGLAGQAAVVAIRIDAERAREAYDLFRVHLSPGHPDPDDLWLSRVLDLKALAKPLIPDLITALGSRHASQREAALDALAMLGPDAKEALPALRELTKSGKDAKHAAEVVRAIEKK